MPPSRRNQQPSNPSTTLTTTKRTFLTRQILLLSSPLTLPHSTTIHTAAETPTLPPTTTTPLLEKINKKITSHNRIHFPIQSQRHILEQIEGVYWRDVLSQGLPVTKAETLVGRNVDLTDKSGVHGLEGGWEQVAVVVDEQDSSTATASQQQDEQQRKETEKERYSILHEALKSRVTRRDHLRKKLSALKRLRGQLEMFEDPKENVQPNLVGFGGGGNKEVESELARMRVLLVKAEGTIRENRQRGGEGQGQGNRGQEEQTEKGLDREDRLQRVLELG